MNPALRLMIYDRSCTGKTMLPGLSHSWWAGGHLYRGLRQLDAFYGAHHWHDALRWIAEYRPNHPIAEIQFWGHGKWGSAKIAHQTLDADALSSEHPFHGALLAIRKRMRSDSLWWFRTCETFGADAGHHFAHAWATWWNCRAAGHTYIIGPLQSGLHSLLPQQTPHWPNTEGISEGSAQHPLRAHPSSVFLPNTISCLHTRIPAGF